MLRYKKFKVSMPSNLKSMCEEYTEQFDCEPFWTYKSVADSKMWTIPPLGKDRRRMYDKISNEVLEQIVNFKQHITEITKLKFSEAVDCIWRFDKNFTHCPIHTDTGGEHTGSVVTSISGNFKIHLHKEDTPNSPILETINVDESNLIALNNTKYPHSVEGQGDLLVLGTDKNIKPEEYFDVV
jgi:hypothetical protein|tara:strand:+ start:887 stop:1435 length:549 start_codon:yes stop_codon:yes gene_type:complete